MTTEGPVLREGRRVGVQEDGRWEGVVGCESAEDDALREEGP